MKKFLVLVFLGPFTSLIAYAQDLDAGPYQPLRLNVEFRAGGSSNNQVPFWLRSNQYGSVPVEGASGSFIGSAFKEYSEEGKRFDWAAGLEGRLNAGERGNASLIQAYLKAKLGAFEFKAGRSRDRLGLVDSVLSSGAFGLSGNAPGVPGLEVSLPFYTEVPLTKRLLSVKGSFSHGWMGKLPEQYHPQNIQSYKSYMHRGAFYARIGRPEWKVKLYGGITHVVIWGSDREIFGEVFTLSTAESFLYVISGKKVHGVRDISKVGNHVGSVDVGVEYDFGAVKALLYRQHFYDKGAVAYLANMRDGLNGVSLENKERRNGFSWKRFLLEVFYSKHQAGEEDAKFTPSGPEYYYNHAVYVQGFSYQGFGLGNPLITPYKFARKGQAHNPANYFINTRVLALHVGSEGIAGKLEYLAKLTYSRNWGDFATSDDDFWFNGERFDRVPEWGLFNPVNQFSGYIQVQRPLPNGFRVGAAVAVDRGKLLYNSLGGFLSLSKSW